MARKITIRRGGSVELNGKLIGLVGRSGRSSHKAGAWTASCFNLVGAKRDLDGSWETRAEAAEALVQDWAEHFPRAARGTLGKDA